MNSKPLFRMAAVLATALTTFPAAAADAPDDDSTLDKISIIGNRTPDYRTQDIQVGPLGSRPVLDMPYSLDVLPDSLSIVLSVLGHREAALRFALFVLTPEAQHLISLYGFDPI